jgi:ABC-type nitrate/sulfonate/bicarbonate transport system substrate-binding protein
VRRALRVGMTPLVDAAPLVVAREGGWFVAEGLAVELSVEPSWANVRDKVAAGVLDAAHMLAPMPIAATLGVGPLHEPMGTALALGQGGNAIALSRPLAARTEGASGPAARARAVARVVAERRAAGDPPLRFGTVFPVSMHSYALGGWLAAAGVAVERDVRLLVVPPPRMVAELEAGAIDGFCVGEPWSTVAALRGSGVIVATGHEIWGRAPEKVLGVTARFAEQNPDSHRALLRAVLRGARECDDPSRRADLARLLAGPRYLDLPLEAVEPALTGALPGAPEPHLFHRDAASFPWRSHAAWIVAQMLRFGQLEKPVDVRAAAASVYWTELHREIAAEVGVAAPGEDERIERFGDDLFDPARPVDWLSALPLHALRVRLDELAAAQGRAG